MGVFSQGNPPYLIEENVDNTIVNLLYARILILKRDKLEFLGESTNKAPRHLVPPL